MSRALADSLVLGVGAMGGMAVLSVYIVDRLFKAPRAHVWQPRIVRAAMYRYADLRGRAAIPRRLVRHRRRDFETTPLPMILIGYFEE